MTMVFQNLLTMRQHNVWSDISFAIYVFFYFVVGIYFVLFGVFFWAMFNLYHHSISLFQCFVSIIFLTNKLIWCKWISIIIYFHIFKTIYKVCKNEIQWYLNDRYVYWIISTFQLIEYFLRRRFKPHSADFFLLNLKKMPNLLQHLKFKLQ